MEPPLIFFNKLLTSLIHSFVDTFGEKKYFYTNYLIFSKKIKGGENAPKKALTLPLQGGSPCNMDQHTLVLLSQCERFPQNMTQIY